MQKLPKGYQNAAFVENKLRHESERKRIQAGEKRALELFHQMAKRVPAYKDFLHAHRIKPADITTIHDFQRLPLLNKTNYLRKYPMEMLCWDGSYGKGQWVISSTSGSLGEPFYFPREHDQDLQYAITAELYLRNQFAIDRKKTLYVVAFPMGAWIGGVFTYEALKIIAGNGYDISVITPGIHKQEVINAVKQLAGSFDQVIIGAYAPFLKDILDDGAAQGIDWPRHKMGFVFSAEAFTEKFRDYIIAMTQPDNPLLFSLNHYGTVDMGTMAHETPESILIRRQLVDDGKLKLLFPESRRQPTFTQYDPELFYFEEEGQNLICSAYSGIPLVRYDLKDYGGIMTRQQVHETLRAGGFNPDDMLRDAGIADKVWNLPFLYIYERNDFSVSYYAFTIYPDMVRRALQAEEFEKVLTGKFTMYVDYDASGRQRLNVHVEMKRSVEADSKLPTAVSRRIHTALTEESSEYRETAREVGNPVKPVVYCHPYESAEYFRPGVKQKWVRKT